MEQSNGTTPTKKKQVFFSIGSYSERDKRVINKISTNGLFSDVTLRNNEHPPREPPPRRVLRERPASLDATDSVKHSQTLPNLRKFKPLSSLVLREDEDALVANNVEKPSCPPSSSGENVCVQQNGPAALDKPTYPPKLYNRSVSLEPEHLKHSGKVALTIAAYEGEPRTPTRLDFLPNQRLSRSSSKASDISSTRTTTPLEEEAAEPIGCRLQNELVATLKRSNLKERNDGDGEAPATPSKHVEFELQNNGRTEEVEVQIEQAELPDGSVKKLATELTKTLVFRTNPEPEANDLPKEIPADKTEAEPEDEHLEKEEPVKEEAKVSEKEHLKEDDQAPNNESAEEEACRALEIQVLDEEEKVTETEQPKSEKLDEEEKVTETAQPKSQKLDEEEKVTETAQPKSQKLDKEEKVTETAQPKSEVKLSDKSIEKSLVDTFDEIITLTDDSEKKK